MNAALPLLIACFVGALHAQQTQPPPTSRRLPRGVFSSRADCITACNGHRDAGCTNALADGSAYCTCQSGYFNNEEQCDNECDDQQFWSLFTYGACVPVETATGLKPVEGMCNQMCAFRVRVWATVFIIILFTSACALLIFLIPLIATTCYTCCSAKKQQRKAEEDAAIAHITGDPHGVVVKPGAGHHQQQAAAAAGWNYPYYGWPYYGGGGGRM